MARINIRNGRIPGLQRATGNPYLMSKLGRSQVKKSKVQPGRVRIKKRR